MCSRKRDVSTAKLRSRPRDQTAWEDKFQLSFAKTFPSRPKLTITFYKPHLNKLFKKSGKNFIYRYTNTKKGIYEY